MRSRKICSLIGLLTFLFIASPSEFMAQLAVSTDTSLIESLEEEEKAEEQIMIKGAAGLTLDGTSVFGAQLFQGNFSNQSFRGFNPEYVVSVGDKVQIMVWGAIQLNEMIPVDPQGNIFLPEIGPVRVTGVKNKDLNKHLLSHVQAVFKNNVEVYASLNSTQTVKVFVSGFAKMPGLYEGFASDSVLYYIDRAGGIDLDRGSFTDIQVMRQGIILKSIDLYAFLSEGVVPFTQFSDGDMILIGRLKNTVTISGAVSSPGRFEFSENREKLESILQLAGMRTSANAITIRRLIDGNRTANVYSMDEVDGLSLYPDDEIDVSIIEKTSSILVSIKGNEIGFESLVLPYGSVLSDAVNAVPPSLRNDIESIQLFRKSVAQRQKDLIMQSLDNLERIAMNARSDSLEEAKLRFEESKLLSQFIAKARNTEPKGQVLLGGLSNAESIYLEDGDVIFVPQKSNLITIYGEVNFPNVMVYKDELSVEDIIQEAGGLTKNADKASVLVIHRNGSIERIGNLRKSHPEPGAEIFILPKPDTKDLQLAKDVSTVIYQIAVAAGVVLRL